MCKTVAAVTAGLMLLAGQALAAGSDTAVVRVGDRVGERADACCELAGIPLSVLPIGAAVVNATVFVATDDDSESDERRQRSAR